MADGVRLAATLYLPDGDGPWPALLEALPYRKDDVTASLPPRVRAPRRGRLRRVPGRRPRHRLVARASPTDEYPARSAPTCVDGHRLARHAGLVAPATWGCTARRTRGFNSIQVAMERPPALKAIIPIFATDDRYADDVHYFGGALKRLDLVDYPTYMVAMNALPPVPSIYGDGLARGMGAPRRRERALARSRWLEHQRVRRLLAVRLAARATTTRSTCPTMIVAGWADGYRNNTLPHVRGADAVPKRLLIGPWAHASTETSLPGPNHDLVPEHAPLVGSVAEGHRQRRGPRAADHGVRAALHAARARPRECAARGATRPTWPAERLSHATLALADAEADRDGDGPDELEVRGDVGWTAWISCAARLPWGQPDDQRPDEVHSLTYDWEPLADELEILGHARSVRWRRARRSPTCRRSSATCSPTARRRS